MGLADLKRITDLFVEGTEVVFAENTDDPVLLWVNKLNSFQTEECQRDGQAARSRTVLATKEHGSAEYLAFEAMMTELDDDGVRWALVDLDNSKRFLDVMDELRRDPDWGEKIEAVTRLSAEMTDDERATVMKVNEDYADELQRRIDQRRDDAHNDLMGLDREGLREKYRTGWLEARGFNSYQREYTKTNLFYAVRVCRATKGAEGGWDHSACEGHTTKALDDREEATRLPSALLSKLIDVTRTLQVDGREARFSAAPPSSSGSSAQPSEGATSAPSTPEATSPELVPTS